jgi:hypothetical protein
MLSKTSPEMVTKLRTCFVHYALLLAPYAAPALIFGVIGRTRCIVRHSLDREGRSKLHKICEHDPGLLAKTVFSRSSIFPARR